MQLLLHVKRWLVASALLVGSSLVAVAYAQTAPTFSGGTGTSADPYQIATAQDLRTLSDYVNGEGAYTKGNNCAGKYFLQTKSIDMSGEDFTPIGRRVTESDDAFHDDLFSGVYDGGGKFITNLTMGTKGVEVIPTDLKRFENMALFGMIGGEGCVVKNVYLKSGKIQGAMYMGGIAAWVKKGATVTRCKVGKDVVIISSRGFVGGIVGGANKGATVTECVNYADVYSCYETSFNTGGIVGSAGDAVIYGCANYGDIQGGRFTGGIVGSYPYVSNPDFDCAYLPIYDCYNAGDVTSLVGCAGGILGGYPNKYPDKDYKVLVNCYSYGQVAAPYGDKAYGPLVGQTLGDPNAPAPGYGYPRQLSYNSYYDVERVAAKQDQTSGNATLGFKHGEPLHHNEMKGEAFVTKLNAGDTRSRYALDTHKINEGYPVLAWMNETYNAEIDLPFACVPETATPYSTSMRMPKLFKPNRGGLFYMINEDKQQPVVNLKGIGFTREICFVQGALAESEVTSYNIVRSTSFFKRPLTSDGLYDKNKEPKAASRWLITPEFTVKSNTPYFVWNAASEDGVSEEGDFRESYEVYIGEEGDVTAEAYKSKTAVFSTKAEDAIKATEEPVTGEDGQITYRTFYRIPQHTLDLQKYVGKKVRIAFHYTSHYKYNLILGRFDVSSTAAADHVSLPVDMSFAVSVADNQLQLRSESGAAMSFHIYAINGALVGSYNGAEVSTTLPSGTYVVVGSGNGIHQTVKVTLP